MRENYKAQIRSLHTGHCVISKRAKVSAVELAAIREAEIADNRSLIARIFGDPPPGRSALDRRGT